MRDQLGVVLTVARDRTLARIELAYLGYNMAEHAVWIAGLVYAFSLGGAGFAGVVALVMLVPAGFVAPFAAYAGDRFRHDRVLLAGYLVQAVTFALSAGALYADASPVITIAALTVASSAVTITRPAQGVLVPAITHSPADLTAANAVSGLAEGLGLCLGPLVAGFLLLAGAPGDVFAAFALVSVVNTALVFRIGFDDGAVHERPGTSVRAILAGSFGGFQYVARDRRVLAIVAVLAGVTLLFGALDVLFVAVAIGYFGESESWAGYLNASVGFGAIAGAAVAVVLVGRRRLTPAFAISASVKGIAIATLAVVPNLGVAAAVFAVAGLASILNNVAGRTLLQRVAPEAVLSRVFGVLEGLGMFALALGSVATGLLIEVIGLPATVVAIGLVLPALVVLGWRVIGPIDQHARQPDPEALALLRGLPIFSPLSAPSIERILAELTWLVLPAGHVLIRQGDAGDRFYVIATGQVEVTRDGRRLAAGGPGYSLGEIALLRNVTRTASVTTLTPVRAIAIERDRFLEAVTGHRASHKRIEAVARDRLSNTGETPLEGEAPP
jgi:MFS family permease